MSPIKSGNLLYAAGYTKKNLLLKLSDTQPAATVLWQDLPDAAISPVNVQPIAHEGLLYGFHQDGNTLRRRPQNRCTSMEQLAALAIRAATANRNGFHCAAGRTDIGFFTEQGDLVIAKNESRRIRRNLIALTCWDPTGRGFRAQSRLGGSSLCKSKSIPAERERMHMRGC